MTTQEPFFDTYIIEHLFKFVNIEDYERLACVNSVTFEYFSKNFASQTSLTKVLIYVTDGVFVIVDNVRHICQMVTRLYLPRVEYAHIVNPHIDAPFIQTDVNNFRQLKFLCLENMSLNTHHFINIMQICSKLYELRLINCNKFVLPPNLSDFKLKVLRIFNDTPLHYSQQSFFSLFRQFKMLEVFDTNGIVFAYDHPSQYFMKFMLFRKEINIGVQTIFHPQLFVDFFTTHWHKVTITFYILGEPFQLFTSMENTNRMQTLDKKMNVPVSPAQYFEVVGRQIHYNNIISFSNVYSKRSVFSRSCMCSKSFFDENIYVAINQSLHNVPENVDEMWLALRPFDISELARYKRLCRIVDINCQSVYKRIHFIGKLKSLTLVRYHDNINIDLDDLAAIINHSRLQRLEIVSPGVFEFDHGHVNYSSPTENFATIESLPMLPISPSLVFVHIPLELFNLNPALWLRMYRPGYSKLTITFRRNDSGFLKTARDIEKIHRLRICGFDTSTYT